jgi:NADH:ubiquinone oxidoreductase subunit 6 (subunit J)
MTLVGAFDWQSLFFVLFASLACLFALAVVLSSNIVRMAFYLTLSLGAVSGLFFLAGAEFVGAMQLMIYVGGTLVLLIFGVMLTAQSRFVTMKTSAADWVMAAAVGGALLAMLAWVAISVPDWSTPREGSVGVADTQVSTAIGLAFTGVRVDPAEQPGEVRSGYLLPFVIVSIHLLVVLIGAAYMARPKRRETPTPARST